MLRIHNATRRLIAFLTLSAFVMVSLGGADMFWYYGRSLLGHGEFPLFSFFGLPGVDWLLVKMHLECALGYSMHCFHW